MSDRLAEQIRIALGEHNDDSEPVTVLVKRLARPRRLSRSELESAASAIERLPYGTPWSEIALACAKAWGMEVEE